MRPIVVPILSCLVMLGVAGCAGNTVSDSSSLDINLSNPSGSNVNLSPIVTGSQFQRTTLVPLNVQVSENPGPAGVSSRLLTINIVTPVQNSEYALTSGGQTYIELDQTTATGTQTWRSIAGKLILGQNDSKASIFTMQDVDFQPFTGGSVGTFRMNGNVQVRF